MDSDGNTYLIGSLPDTLKATILDEPRLIIPKKKYQQYLEKIDNKGNILWIKLLDTATRFIDNTIMINNNDQLFVYSNSTGGARVKTSYFIHEFNDNGITLSTKEVFSWQGEYRQLHVKNVAIGADNGMYLSAQFNDTIIFNKQDTLTSTYTDFFILKINQHGNYSWHNGIDALYGGLNLNALHTDHNGNAYLTGNYNSSVIIDNDTTSAAGINSSNGFIVRYDKSGENISQFHIEGSHTIAIKDLTTDIEDNLYIIGEFYGNTNLNVPNLYIQPKKYTRAFLLKMDQTFNEKWIHFLGTGSAIEGIQISINKNNILSWIGEFEGQLDLDPTVIIDMHYSSCFVQHYNTSGNFLSSKAINLKPSESNQRIVPTENPAVFFIYKKSSEPIPNEKYKHTYKIALTKLIISNNDNVSNSIINSCKPYLWPKTGKTYDQSGIYYSDKTDGQIDTLDFTRYTIDNSVLEKGLILKANASNASFKWYNVSDGWIEQEEKSHLYNVTKTGTYAVEITSTICPIKDTSILIKKLVAPISKDILKRFYDPEDDILVSKIEREHIQLNPNHVRMIPFRKERLYGFVSAKNPEKWLIDPKFAEVFAIYEEGAIVKDSSHYGGYGLCNLKGDYLINPIYPNLFKEQQIYHGISSYATDTSLHLPTNYSVFNQHDYYNTSGKLLFKEKSHEHESYMNEEFAWFRFGTTYHIRNLKGQLIKEFEWDANRHFIGIADGLLLFNEDKSVSAYTIDDNLVFTIPVDVHNKIYKLGVNHYGLLSNNADYYFLDGMGKPKPYSKTSFAIGFFSSDQRFFSQDYFIVQDNERSGLGVIDRNGNTILPFRYSQIGPLVNGHRICTDTLRKATVVDQNGNLVYDYPKPFELPASIPRKRRLLINNYGFYEGLALTSTRKLPEDLNDPDVNWRAYEDSTYFCYYNELGEIVLELPTTILLAGHFSEGLAPAVNANKQLGFIDLQGNWAIEPKYELSVAGAYPMPYIVIPKFIGGFVYIKSFKGYVDKDGREYFSGEQVKDSYNFSH